MSCLGAGRDARRAGAGHFEPIRRRCAGDRTFWSQLDAGVLGAGHLELAAVATPMLETIRVPHPQAGPSVPPSWRKHRQGGIKAGRLKQPGPPPPGTLLRTPRQQCKQEGRAIGQATAATDNSQPDAKRSGTPDLLHEDFMADSNRPASHLLVLPGPLEAQSPTHQELTLFTPCHSSATLSGISTELLLGAFMWLWLRNHRARYSHSGLP